MSVGNAIRWMLALGTALFAVSVQAQWVTQDIELEPGWNAVFLEIAPEPSDCASIFSEREVESVWMWNRRFTTIDYDLDPNELLPDDPHWMAWFPPDSPQSFLSRLFGMSGSSAYLVKVPANAAPYTLTVKGRAAIPYFEWFPHTMNLVGLPVNPGNSPNFTDFFRHTESIDTSKGHQNELYTLDSSGEGTRIFAPARVDIEPGQAYWIKCAERPVSAAPFVVEAPSLAGLEFGRAINERDLVISNPSETASVDVSIRQKPSAEPPAGFPELAGDVPLSYLVYDSSVPEWEWMELAPGATLDNTLSPGEEWLIRFGVRRGDFEAYTPVGTNGAAYQSVLEINGFENTVRYRVGVQAEDAGVAPPGAASDSQYLYKGLWVGEAHLFKVNCPAYSSSNLLMTDSLCKLRLLMHVDESGQARLLQEAFLAWVPLSETNGVYRLYSRRENLPADASDVSRISSVAFPLMDPVMMSGTMTNILAGTIAVDCNDPVNPFLHRYNPLHDNKDWDYNTYTNAVETRSVIREIEMDFTSGVSTNIEANPVWGSELLGGTYREKLSGLREQEIIVEGWFELNRVSSMETIY